MANLPYNEKDISSIFNYSKHLLNKCLRDFAPNAEEHKGKGSLGQLVEELFFPLSPVRPRICIKRKFPHL